MKVTLEQLAERIDSMNDRLVRLEAKVDDQTALINKSKGIIGFVVWVGSLGTLLYNLVK